MIRLYTLFRDDFFYPLEIDTDDDKVALDCVTCNPGTKKIIRNFPLPGETIYNQDEK